MPPAYQTLPDYHSWLKESAIPSQPFPRDPQATSYPYLHQYSEPQYLRPQAYQNIWAGDTYDAPQDLSPNDRSLSSSIYNPDRSTVYDGSAVTMHTPTAYHSQIPRLPINFQAEIARKARSMQRRSKKRLSDQPLAINASSRPSMQSQQELRGANVPTIFIERPPEQEEPEVDRMVKTAIDAEKKDRNIQQEQEDSGNFWEWVQKNAQASRRV